MLFELNLFIMLFVNKKTICCRTYLLFEVIIFNTNPGEYILDRGAIQPAHRIYIYGRQSINTRDVDHLLTQFVHKHVP